MKSPHLGNALRKVLLLWIILPGMAAAQQTAGPPGGATGATGGTTNRREVVPVRPTFPQPEPGVRAPQERMQPPIFLAGDVVSDDGSPPPYGAVIEVDCMGSVTREAIVGNNGRFSFQFGGENRFGQVFPDASQSPYSIEMDQSGASTSSSSGSMARGQRVRRLLGCEVRAQLAGYLSTSIRVTEEPTSRLNELGTIVVYPRSRVQGNMVSVSDLMAPKSARKSLELGKKAVQKEKLAEAEVLFKSAVQAYPKYAEAWFDLGLIYERQGLVEESSNAYREALTADPLFLKPYIRLAQGAAMRQNWREAADLTEKVISLDPVTRVEAYLINALAHLNLNELDISQKRANEGQRRDVLNRFPQFHLILADVFAARRDPADSAKELRSYLKSVPNGPNAGSVRARLQTLEKQANENQAAGSK